MDYFEFLSNCVKTADEIRSLRKQTPSPVAESSLSGCLDRKPECAVLKLDKKGNVTNLESCFTSKCDDCVDGGKGCWGNNNCNIQRLRCVTTPCPKTPVPTGAPAKWGDPPTIYTAVTGKGNRQAHPLEVVGETVPIDWTDEPAIVKHEEPTPGELLIVEHIKRLPGYREPQSVVPQSTAPPDESAGRWITRDEARDIRGVSIDTLADYRTQGIRSEDGLSGIDAKNWHWKQDVARGRKVNTRYFLQDNSDRS